MASENSGLGEITKAARAKPALPMKALNSSNDPFGVRRMEKTRAKTPQGIMRLADKIIEEALEYGLPQKPSPESSP